MTKKFIVEIASVPDRKRLVAEVWLGDVMVAEVNQEQGELEIEIYVQDETTLRLDYESFITALEEGKTKLAK